MATKITKSAQYVDTCFGTLALNRTLPTIGRLFGFESSNQRLFLGRSRVPAARVDLFAQMDQVGLENRPIMGFISVHQVQVFPDPNFDPTHPDQGIEPTFQEVSRLQKFGVSRVAARTYAQDQAYEFELFSLPTPEQHDNEHHRLRVSSSMADLMAVALLNAAG